MTTNSNGSQENVDAIQKRVSSSLEKILLCSSVALNKPMNWRKLWTPYAYKNCAGSKTSQECCRNPAVASIEALPKGDPVTRSAQIAGFASKFYDEMERRYFRGTKTSTKDKENAGAINSKLGTQEHINMAQLAKSSEHLRNILGDSDSDRENEERPQPQQQQQKEPDLVSYETDSAKVESQHNTDRKQDQVSASAAGEGCDNVILSTYQNAVRSVRCTRTHRTNSPQTLDVVREDTRSEGKAGMEDIEAAPSDAVEYNMDLGEENIQDSQEMRKEEEEKMPDPEPETKKEEVDAPKENNGSATQGASRLVVEKMSKYEAEMQELKDILFKTFEYVTHLKNDMSAAGSKQSIGTAPAIVQTSTKFPPSSLLPDRSPPQLLLDSAADPDRKRSAEDSFRSSNSSGLSTSKKNGHLASSRPTARSGRGIRRPRTRLRRMRRKLMRQVSRNRTLKVMLDQVRGDVEQLKREARVNAVGTMTVARGTESPTQRTVTSSIGGQVTTARQQSAVMLTQAKEQKTIQQENGGEELAYLEELNEKLTKQLEDNMQTMEELYTNHEQKARELESRDRDIQAKNQQISELKVMRTHMTVG